MLIAGDIDIVHLHVGGRWIQFVVRSASRAPAIAHLHGPPLEPSDEPPSARASMQAAQRVMNSRPVRILTCNDLIAGDMVAAIPGLRGRIGVIPYGVDAARFRAFDRGSAHALSARQALGLDASDFVLAFVGRLVPQKGIGQLIEIVERIASKVPGLKLVVIGDGPLRMELERLSQLMGQGRVTLMGERRDVERWLPACDVLALTSKWEPFGIVSLEAMASGRVVVGFAIDGVPAVVDHGVTGLLVNGGA